MSAHHHLVMKDELKSVQTVMYDCYQRKQCKLYTRVYRRVRQKYCFCTMRPNKIEKLGHIKDAININLIVTRMSQSLTDHGTSLTSVLLLP